METVLYHSNILSESDVPFINWMHDDLGAKGLDFVLTGWNTVPNTWGLNAIYYKLPFNIQSYDMVYASDVVRNELDMYGLDVNFLLERFTWWFSESKSLAQEQNRMAFLHYHLHHYLRLINTHNPGILMIWNGNDPRHCILRALGEYYNIKMLFLERGPLPSVLFYDRVGVLSHSSVASLPMSAFEGLYEINEQRSDYSDWYMQSDETLWEQPESIDLSLRARYGIADDQKITLFIGQVDNDIQTKLFCPYFSNNLEAFKWFLDHCRDENHFVIGKHHPKNSLSVEVFETVLIGTTNAVWINDVALDECLRQVDNVVAVNSSVIFDAMFYQKPVLTLGVTMLDGKDILYECHPDNKDMILKDFYDAHNFDRRLNNFEHLLGYMFAHNLLFTKDRSSAKAFADNMEFIFEVCDNQGSTKKNENVLRSYENSIIRQKTTNKSLIKKVSRKIKDFIKTLMKSTKT